MGKHETSIYRKVIITFTVILLGVLDPGGSGGEPVLYVFYQGAEDHL